MEKWTCGVQTLKMEMNKTSENTFRLIYLNHGNWGAFQLVDSSFWFQIYLKMVLKTPIMVINFGLVKDKT